MQAPPPQAAQPPHHAVGRGRRQHRHADERHEPDGEIEPLHDLGRDLGEIEGLIGDVEGEMRRKVAERSDADHPSDVDQHGEARDIAQRRDGERHQEEDQAPVAGAMDQVVERAGAEAGRRISPRRNRDRHEQHDKRDDPQDGESSALVAPQLEGV